MSGPRALAASVLIAFTAFSLWVFDSYGVNGFFGWVFHNTATIQVFADLTIALTLAMVAITADARRRGVASWPWWLLALLTGSIGALAYWAFRRQAAGPGAGARHPNA
jgi:hypothetical protein